VIDSLFGSIHSYQNYPLLVTGPAFNGSFKNISSAEKLDGFSMMLEKGDDDTLFSTFKTELKTLSDLTFWNSRGRFIVIFLKRNFSAVNIVPEEHALIANILGEFWESDIVNAILLAPTINTDNSTTLDIHT
jgi:hypothetical protein